MIQACEAGGSPVARFTGSRAFLSMDLGLTPQALCLRPFHGLTRLYVNGPGAYAPGFMLAPASQADALFLRGGRVDNRFNLRDVVCRKAAAPRVLVDHFFTRRDVDAIEFIIRDVTLNPLNLRSHLIQNVAGSLRHRLQLRGR